MWVTLLEDHITGNKDAIGSNILDFVIPRTTCISKQTTLHAARIQLRNLGTMDSGNLCPTLGAKSSKVGDILPPSGERFKGYKTWVTTRGNQVPCGDRVSCSFSPVRVCESRITK
jgi:hypothetical protein